MSAIVGSTNGIPVPAGPLFPSNFCFPHEVRPPVGGDRYCVVNWFSVWPVTK